VIPVLILGLLIGASLGFVLGRLTSRPEHLTILKEHTRLLRKASRAYRKNEPGVANIYTEAAERLAPALKELESER
jgi:membrane protein DedA with SNARE-associated domain